MEVSTKEKKEIGKLNQAHLKARQKSSNLIQGTTPATAINIAELVIVLGAAMTVDAIDFLDLTVVGAVLVRFIDIPILGALWLWRIFKGKSKKDPTFAILMTFLVELSPIGMVPGWSIFVIYVYFQDSKLGQKTIGKSKKITKGKK